VNVGRLVSPKEGAVSKHMLLQYSWLQKCTLQGGTGIHPVSLLVSELTLLSLSCDVLFKHQSVG
jgi:hypothetical protein